MSERVPPPAGPDWLRGVLAGDASAIDVCCREQHAAVYRLCLGFLASASDAEDTALAWDRTLAFLKANLG